MSDSLLPTEFEHSAASSYPELTSRSALSPLGAAQQVGTSDSAALQGAGNRLQSLDGLRAVSVFMVFVGHCAGTKGCPLQEFDTLGHLAALGVRVFFVISGFLITSLLLREFRDTRRIDLIRFYARRSLRIFPPAYVFIATVGLCEAAGLLQLKPNDMIHAFAYTMNYHPEHGWPLAHLWSLGVEEQFYLLWPAVIAIAGINRAMVTAALAVAICPMVRLGMIYILGTDVGVNRVFPAVADALASGCLLAGLRSRLEINKVYMGCMRSRSMLLLPLAILLFNAVCAGHPKIMSAVGVTALNLSTAIWLHWCLLFHDGYVGGLLNSRPFVTVGLLSYSLYLWQQLFLNRSSDLLMNRFPLNVLLAVAAAAISYFLLERPLLRLRGRLRPVRAEK